MAAFANGQEWEVQKNYWVEHSTDLTVEAMMLDSKASDLDKEERPEVLSLLPPYEGKSVVELRAGIGRFTGELAENASQLFTLDFIDSVIKKNESINGQHKNVKFIWADVTSPDLKISENSVDLVFSNWLLMYLSDKEVEYLVEKMMGWLKVGGYIFFRESYFHQSGDSKRKSNPTHYKEPRFYTKVHQLVVLVLSQMMNQNLSLHRKGHSAKSEKQKLEDSSSISILLAKQKAQEIANGLSFRVGFFDHSGHLQLEPLSTVESFDPIKSLPGFAVTLLIAEEELCSPLAWMRRRAPRLADLEQDHNSNCKYSEI
ncbi:hypothetical protein ACFX14_001221 [Malus domestica]